MWDSFSSMLLSHIVRVALLLGTVVHDPILQSHFIILAFRWNKLLQPNLQEIWVSDKESGHTILLKHSFYWACVRNVEKKILRVFFVAVALFYLSTEGKNIILINVNIDEYPIKGYSLGYTTCSAVYVSNICV